MPENPTDKPTEKPQKSWQARIGEATDALAQSFVESISYDRRIYKHDIAGSIAHATMLAKVGLITDAERDAIIDGLKSSSATSRPATSRSTRAWKTSTWSSRPS